MARQLPVVELHFIETAPERPVFAQEVSAPPEGALRALAEDVPGWAEWFPAVTPARSTGDLPRGLRPKARLLRPGRPATPHGAYRSGQTPVSSSEPIAVVYGSMSSPCSASQVSE